MSRDLDIRIRCNSLGEQMTTNDTSNDDASAPKEASATGYADHASATGDYGHASATGVNGHAIATGIDGIAVAVGIRARAKAAVGGWIVVARYGHNNRLIEVKTAQIGTNCLRPDVWYSLNESGEFVEAT